MRAQRLALAVAFVAPAVGCSQKPGPSPASKAARPAAAAVPAAKPKTTVVSEPSQGLDFAESPEGSLDVNSINPVKVNRNAAAGSGFNPFAK